MRASLPSRSFTWPCAVPVAGSASPSNGSTTTRHLAFVETRHQFREVAGTETDIELLAQDIVPAILAGAGGARQREDIGRVGNACRRTALHRRGADLLEADPAESLAEAVDLFFEQEFQRLGRDVAAGHAGAAGGDHYVDLVVVDPLLHLGADLVHVVGDDRTI